MVMSWLLTERTNLDSMEMCGSFVKMKLEMQHISAVMNLCCLCRVRLTKSNFSSSVLFDGQVFIPLGH